MSYNYIRAQDTEESCQQFFIRNFFITQCALQVGMDTVALSLFTDSE